MPQLANCWQSSTSAIFIQVPPTPTIGEVKDSVPDMQKAIGIAQIQIWPQKISTKNA